MSKKLNMSAVENCVCFNLRWVTRAVTQFYNAEMRRHGIRPTQGSILAALSAKDSWNMAELSDALGMDRTTLVRNLRPLQRDGFVGVDGGHTSLENKTTLVTGVTSGIGREIAQLLAERGAHVFGTVRDPKSAKP